MRLMRYQYTISHIPGKQLVTADALSRAPVESPDINFSEEVQSFVNSVVTGIPATSKCLERIRQCQAADKVCQEIIRYCNEGWPREKKKFSVDMRPYYQFTSKLNVINGLLLRGHRIIIPIGLRKEMLVMMGTRA